ncbi:MAG: helix-turn-helix domain-containing protein [Burkholderiales bacterium]|nr:helix-turn-helix domain-containing protein [Burkholderiales bacterium]
MHDFTVLVLPGAFATSVAATLDMLGAAASLAPRLKLAAPAWRVVSAAGGAVPLGNGMSVQATALPARRRADRSTWIIPGLGTESVKAIAARLAQPDSARAAAAVKAHLAAGGAVAASCSAVFLLQACGALAGRRVTTSWWLAAELQRLEPGCVVAADRMVCVDGPVTTAGAAFAQVDLMLALLQSRFGVPLADLVRRVLLADARQAQTPYTVPAMMSSGNALVARLTAHLESALPHPPSVAALAKKFAMSERTLARHVRAATGMTPLALLQGVRLNRARMLIETTRLNIEQVAAQVGYEDATALRRLMRRLAGANPGRFRAQVAA